MTVRVENLLRNSSITNNIELEWVANNLLKNFVGVFSSDEIPILDSNESCIMNTKPKSSGGEHWCSIINWKGKIYFYDSYKRPYYTLSKYWKHKKWIQPQMGNHPDESEFAANCGQLCISALYVFYKYGPYAWDII